MLNHLAYTAESLKRASFDLENASVGRAAPISSDTYPTTLFFSTFLLNPNPGSWRRRRISGGKWVLPASPLPVVTTSVDLIDELALHVGSSNSYSL